MVLPSTRSVWSRGFAMDTSAVRRKFDRWTKTLTCCGAWLIGLAASVGCAGAQRFSLRPPMQRDDDERPFLPPPREYFSPFAWDGANQMVFRPVSRFFAVDPAGEAINVNSLDEVPNSSWFENRLGTIEMTPETVERGSCSEKRLDPNAPDGTWVIDKGKANGANPGFRISVAGIGKFMLKIDPPTEPDRATGATAIASRIYHAVGYHSACDTVVYVRESLLRLKPGLTVTNNQGVTRPLDAEHLRELLSGASRRRGLIRMVASAWLPGTPLGPYRYDGTRSDDPNDVIAHEDRRELRGARLIAAWLNHFDSREQNSMDVFIRPGAQANAPGYVRHYIMDMGDCFGSVWENDGISRRLGHSYLLDFGHVAADFISLGTITRPWERARRSGGVFNYFSARDFDPEAWRGEYPNPAFSRMTEWDGAWMARILAHFTQPLLAAAVRVGQYDSDSERYLLETLALRRDAILRRYLSHVSPLGDVGVTGDRLCGVDLARRAGVVPNEGVSVRARAYLDDRSKPGILRVDTSQLPRICAQLEHGAIAPQVPAADSRRYLVVDLDNGYASGPLRAHLYDLGQDSGFRLAGIERPLSHDPP